MDLQTHFETIGNWLFRWRSYLPLAMVGLVLMTFRHYHYLGNSVLLDHVWEGVCLLVSFLGLGIRVFTIGYTPKRTSGRNTKKQVAESLNTTGMYSIVRNPLYLGNFFVGLGLVLFAHFWWLTLIYILLFWIYYERIIFAEETYLKNKFGGEFLEYANRTPVFIPKLNLYKPPILPFSWKKVIRQEYNTFAMIIFVMFVLEMVGDFVVNGAITLDWGWACVLAIGLMVWGTVRILKKYTSVLDEKDR